MLLMFWIDRILLRLFLLLLLLDGSSIIFFGGGGGGGVFLAVWGGLLYFKYRYQKRGKSLALWMVD